MRTKSLARRSLAVVTATALMSGGLASGLLATSAYAVIPMATVTSVSPTSWDNRSTGNFTISGSGFQPQDVVHFYPCDVKPWTVASVPNDTICHTIDGASAHEVARFNATVTATTATSATVKPNLSLAPAGVYYLTVEHFDGTESIVARSNTTGAPIVTVRIYDIGVASLRSIARGFDSSGGACGDPSGVVADCTRGGGALDLVGSNFSIGADVQFRTSPSGGADPGLHFSPGNPGNANNTIGTAPNGTGYPSSTLIQGNYSVTADGTTNTPAFTPGRHYVKVINTYRGDIPTPEIRDQGSTVEFWQPWFRDDAVSVDTPIGVATGSNEIGAGAQDVTVVLKGRGFRSTSTMWIAKASYLPGVSCSDITVASQAVSPISPVDAQGNDSKIVAQVDVASCTTPTPNGGAPRSVTVSDPGGASWSRAAQLTINPAPVATATNFATLGQGAQQQVFPVTGTNFAADSVHPSAATCPLFDFGPNVHVTTVSCPSSQSASVRVNIDQGAAVGDRPVTVTNPADRGMSTTQPDPANGAPLTITAGPVVKTVSQSSFTPGTDTPVTVTGTGFESSSNGPTMNVEILTPDGSGPYPGVQAVGVNVIKASVQGGDDQVQFSLHVEPDALPGQPLFVLTNPTDHGRYACSCLGVDSLGIFPTPVANTGLASLTLTGFTPLNAGASHLGDSIGAHSTVTLVRNVPLTGQPDIVAASVARTGADTASSSVDLTSVAPGKYNVVVVADTTNASSATWNCTACLTVTGAAMTTTDLFREPGDKPAQAPQGLSGISMKLTGTNFSKGMQVDIPGLTPYGFVLQSPSVLTFSLDVPADVAAGTKTVTVTSGDGSGTSTGSTSKTETFVVTAKPSPTGTPSPASYASGAGSAGYLAANTGSIVSITVQGQDFQSDATLSLGPDVAVSGATVTPGCTAPAVGCLTSRPDSLTAKVDVAESAVPGKRDVVIVNGDGGRGTLVQGFTVVPGPQVSAVTDPSGLPLLKPDGLTHSITVTGSNFVSNPKSLLVVLTSDGSKPEDSANVDVTNVTVVSPTTITADVKVATGATRGARTVGVTNTTDKGYGSCSTCAYVASPPGIPPSLKLVAGASSLTATWGAAADNGAPVTGYRVTAQRVGTALVLSKDVPGSAPRTATFNALFNGASYVVRVQAVNAVGGGLTAQATGIPGLVTTLTSVASTRLVTSGTAMRFSGKLLHGTAAVPNRTVSLRFTPSIGAAFTRSTFTSSTGAWSYRYTPVYTFTMKATFSGDNVYRPTSASLKGVAVAARVTRTAPANGSTSSATTLLKIVGVVSPNKHGRTVYLYRFVGGSRTLVARAVLNTRSTFVFAIKPTRGSYTFRVYIGATPGNVAAYSAAFTLKRV